MTYKFKHSIECSVTKAFAWQFWADVNNWSAVDPAVESVELDGPFTAGTKGVTKLYDSAPADWKIVEVKDGESALIEILAPGAVLRFHWVFELLSAGGGVLITQHVSLQGERVKEYLEGMKELEKGIPDGMNRLALAMVAAENGGQL